MQLSIKYVIAILPQMDARSDERGEKSSRRAATKWRQSQWTPEGTSAINLYLNLRVDQRVVSPYTYFHVFVTS